MNWFRRLFGKKRTEADEQLNECYPGTAITKVGFHEWREDVERGVCGPAVGLIDKCSRGGRGHRLSLCHCLSELAEAAYEEMMRDGVGAASVCAGQGVSVIENSR